jgi:hypothetical protein
MKIEKAAQAVLEARAEYPDAALATLYNRAAMPVSLRKAHNDLDKAVLNAYGLKSNATDAGVLEVLFNMYAELTEGLLATAPAKRKR